MSPLDRHAQVQAAILESLPAGSGALERALGVSTPTMHKHLQRLHAKGLIHIGEWGGSTHAGVVGRIWHAGPGMDAERPEPSKNALACRQARARKAEQTDCKARKVAGSCEWLLQQLKADCCIPVTEIRRGPRTQQALDKVLNRLVAEGRISLRKGYAVTGHPVRMVRKGAPKTDEESQAQETARDRISSLARQKHADPSVRSEMLAMIWATAGRSVGRPA